MIQNYYHGDMLCCSLDLTMTGMTVVQATKELAGVFCLNGSETITVNDRVAHNSNYKLKNMDIIKYHQPKGNK